MQGKDYSKNRSRHSLVFPLNAFLKSKNHQTLIVSTTRSKLASGILYLLFILHKIELGYRYIATTCCQKILYPSPNADAMLKNVAAVSTSISRKSNFSNRIGATSLLTFLFIVCMETVLFSTMSSCAKTFYMHWNTSNSIFRIDNTDHIIDVNKGNLAFEFDQVHIICPVYEPGTFENETEKYIIYNVSKVEYETCRITNADPRVIAICDKPQKLMFFTITFRPFTPQPGGLEFLPGKDYYFISTSSKEDLYRRIGGRCSTNNMKVVFKVCCESEKKALPTAIGESVAVEVINSILSTNESIINGKNSSTSINANNREFNLSSTTLIESNVLYKEISTYSDIPSYYTSQSSAINKNSNSINGVKVQPSTSNALGSSFENTGFVTHNYNYVTLSGAIDELIPHLSSNYRGQGVILINNVQHSHQKNRNTNLSSNNAGNYNKLPKKVIKNHEVAYNGGEPFANCMFCRNYSHLYHRNTILNCLSKILHLSLLTIICNIFRFYI